MQSEAKGITNMTTTQHRAFTIVARGISKKSKFYAQDMKDLREYYETRPDADCLETIQRWNSIDSITEEESNLHCQFGGLL